MMIIISTITAPIAIPAMRPAGELAPECFVVAVAVSVGNVIVELDCL
jgi:hypothetical protein